MDYIKLGKDDEVVLGALYKFESELMKIVVKNPDFFHVGDTITCDYANVRFSSKILKKQDSQIYALVPQTYKQFPNEKRKHPRIAVDLDGIIIPYINPTEVKIKIVDLSRMGVGFITKKEDQQINIGEVCKIIINFSANQIKAHLKIKNCEQYPQENRYGCEIHSIYESDEFELRKFILTEQLKRNMVY